MSGPKRPHDRVSLSKLKEEFLTGLTEKVGFKSYGLSQDSVGKKVNINYKGEDYELGHGSVIIAAITSCTNTSNPDVMLAAGLLAKAAVEKGLKVKPYIKTTLSPGSGVVKQYLSVAGLQDSLN